MSKEKPTNIAASVQARLKNLAVQRGLDFGLVLSHMEASASCIASHRHPTTIASF